MDEEKKDVTKEEREKEAQQPFEEPCSNTETTFSPKISYYNFIQKHGTLLLALGSACVTILAACMRLSSYLYHLSYWRYWNIDSSLISSSETYWLENTVLSFLLVISGTLLLKAVTTIFKIYIIVKVARRKLSQVFQDEKNIAKKARKTEKNIRQYIKEKARFQKKTHVTAYDDEITEMNMMRVDLNEAVKDREEATKKQIKNIKQQERATFVSFLAASLKRMMIFIAIIILSSLRFTSFLRSVLFSIIFVVVLLLYYFLREYSLEKKLLYEMTTDELRLRIQNVKMEPIGEQIKKESVLSNHQIRFYFTIILCSCIIFPFANYLLGHNAAKIKTEYMIIESNDCMFAVIAIDSDYLIAEPIIINGNTAEINTDQKTVFSKENEPIIETIEFATPPKIKKEAKQ